MPNWCYTQYVFIGSSKELDRLERNISRWTESLSVPNGFGKNRLGNIVAGAGFSQKEIPCRGILCNMYRKSDLEMETPRLHIDTETAWVPMHELWNRLIKKYSPGYRFLYYSEEPGCGIYETNDTEKEFFGFDYVADAFYDYPGAHENIRERFEEGISSWSEEDLHLVIADILKKDLPSDMLLYQFDAMQESWTDDSFIHINAVQRVSDGNNFPHTNAHRKDNKFRTPGKKSAGFGKNPTPGEIFTETEEQYHAGRAV